MAMIPAALQCECGGVLQEWDDFLWCPRCSWCEEIQEAKPMSKRKKRARHRQQQDFVDAEIMLATLQSRAIQLSIVRAHSLGQWTSAKKNFGKAARRSECVRCRKDAVIMPYGNNRVRDKVKFLPAVAGKAIFEDCQGLPLKQDLPIKHGTLIGER